MAGAVGPAGGQESYGGLFDSSIAVTWRIVDELISDAPSVAVRLGAIVAGGYDTGYINSLGDGGNGVEASLLVGKFWDAAGVSTEIGYRNRTSTEVNPMAVGAGMSVGELVDIPEDMFFNLGFFVPAGSRVTIGIDYRMVNALSGIDIGGPGVSPSRFPGLRRTVVRRRERLLRAGRGRPEHCQLPQIRRRPQLRIRRQLLTPAAAGGRRWSNASRHARSDQVVAGS